MTNVLVGHAQYGHFDWLGKEIIGRNTKATGINNIGNVWLEFEFQDKVEEFQCAFTSSPSNGGLPFVWPPVRPIHYWLSMENTMRILSEVPIWIDCQLINTQYTPVCNNNPAQTLDSIQHFLPVWWLVMRSRVYSLTTPSRDREILYSLCLHYDRALSGLDFHSPSPPNERPNLDEDDDSLTVGLLFYVNLIHFLWKTEVVITWRAISSVLWTARTVVGRII